MAKKNESNQDMEDVPTWSIDTATQEYIMWGHIATRVARGDVLVPYENPEHSDCPRCKMQKFIDLMDDVESKLAFIHRWRRDLEIGIKNMRIKEEIEKRKMSELR